MPGIGDPVLAAAVGRDPVPAADRRNSHVHVIAYPQDALRLPAGAVDAAVRTTGRRVPGGAAVFPGWRQLTRREHRGAGTIGFSSSGLAGRRLQPHAEERELLDLEISADGRVLLFCGRASDRHTPTQVHVVIDGGIVTLTRSVATMAGLLGDAAGYAGGWCLAVAVSGLAGRPSVHALYGGPADWRSPITAAGYARSTGGTTDELLDRPERATHRLVGPLLDALGTTHQHRLQHTTTDDRHARQRPPGRAGDGPASRSKEGHELVRVPEPVPMGEHPNSDDKRETIVK